MNLQMYSIFDKKTVQYMQPFFAKHVAEATRNVQMVLEDGKTLLAKFTADYALYLLGTVDTDTGLIVPPAQMAPQFVIECVSLLAVNQFPGGEK